MCCNAHNSKPWAAQSEADWDQHTPVSVKLWIKNGKSASVRQFHWAPRWKTIESKLDRKRC